MTAGRPDEPRSELYRRQAEEARREIEAWPAWMRANLRPTATSHPAPAGPTPIEPAPAEPRSALYERQATAARAEMATWPSWLTARGGSGHS